MQVRQELKAEKKRNGLQFRDHPSCAKYDNPISGPTSSTNHPDPLAAPTRPVEPLANAGAHTPVPSGPAPSVLLIYITKLPPPTEPR